MRATRRTTTALSGARRPARRCLQVLGERLARDDLLLVVAAGVHDRTSHPAPRLAHEAPERVDEPASGIAWQGNLEPDHVVVVLNVIVERSATKAIRSSASARQAIQ